MTILATPSIEINRQLSTVANEPLSGDGRAELRRTKNACGCR